MRQRLEPLDFTYVARAMSICPIKPVWEGRRRLPSKLHVLHIPGVRGVLLEQSQGITIWRERPPKCRDMTLFRVRSYIISKEKSRSHRIHI